MKKKLAHLLVKLAHWIHPSIIMENTPEARPMGICVHISKKDVRNFRKDHPEVKSHREGLRLLIEEAKWQVAGAIARGMVQKKVIDFNISKTLYVADVGGIAFVYGGKKRDNGSEEA